MRRLPKNTLKNVKDQSVDLIRRGKCGKNGSDDDDNDVGEGEE